MVKKSPTKMSNLGKFWLLKLILYPSLLCGLIFFSVGIITFIYDEDTEGRCTERVTAIVSSNISYDSYNGTDHKNRRRYRYLYAPVYKYTYNNKEYSVESSNRTYPAKYNIDDTAVIMINPANPEEIYEPEFTETSMNSIIFIVVGAVMLLGDIIILFYIISIGKKLKNNPKQV